MEGKRKGRPPKSDAEKRQQIGVRTSSELKAQLEEAAGRNGRSVAQEAEMRLGESFEWFSNTSTRPLLAEVAQQIARAEAATGKRWNEDIATHQAAMKLIERTMRTAFLPPRYEETNRLAAERAELQNRHHALTTMLLRCKAIANGRNALLALDMESPPQYRPTDEQSWINPTTDPDVPLSDEERTALHNWMNEWKAAGEKIEALTAQINEVLDPYWAQKAAGDRIATALLTGDD